MRIARILWGLQARPQGWRFDAIERDLGVSERTLLRYVKACREALVDGRGRALVEVVRRGDRRVLTLTQPGPGADPAPQQVLAFFLARAVFQLFQRAGLAEEPTALWARLRRGLARADQLAFAELERKLVAVPDGVPDLGAGRDHLGVVLEAVMRQRRLRIEYRPEGGGAVVVEDVDPYSLALAGTTLHVVARRLRDDRLVRFALEGIQGATLGEEWFAYPVRYKPSLYTDGGVIVPEGDETDVSILVRDPEAIHFARTRPFHPTQRCIRQQGGAAMLTMRMRCTDALRRWILSLGAGAEVIAPAALRDDVRRAHDEAAALYAR